MARRYRGVPWTNLGNVVETGDRLLKVGGANSTWDAGADTRGVLTIPGGRDGYIEFWADSRGMNAMMGLSYQGTGLGFSDIDFAVYISGYEFQAYEAGSNVYAGGAGSYPISSGVVRVERLAGSIYYKLDGTTKYSHALTAAQQAAALYADASFYKIGDYLVGWRMSIDELDDAAPICAPLRGVGHLATVLAVAFPSGTRRYSTSPIASATDGFYSQRLVSLGKISRSIGDRSYSAEPVSLEAVVADEDGSLAVILATERAYWSAVTIEAASQDVPNSSWLTEFAGRLHSWKQSVPVDGVPTFALRFRGDDLALRSPAPDGRITSADFPAIAPEASGFSERQIYGRQHTQGIAGVGGNPPDALHSTSGVVKVPCVQPWNGTSWQGYIGNGIIKIVQVFVGGVAQTTPATWTALTPTLGGRIMSTLALLVDPGDAEVTVSCEGYDWYGDGSGWQNYAGGPEHWADVVKHWLSNHVFNKWKIGGYYQADPTKIDLASLADVKLALGRVAAGRVVMNTGDARAAMESLNEACASVGVYPIFTREGRIGFVLDDPLVSASDQYNAPLILAQRAGGFESEWVSEGQAKRVVLSFAHSQAEGQYLGSHEVQDPDVTPDSSVTIEAPWSPTMLITPPPAVVLNDAGADPVLTLWICAKRMLQDYNSGDSIGTLRDLSPLGHDFTQATGSKQPKFRFYPKDERAWIEFDGVDDRLDAITAALSNYKVSGGWTCLVAFRARSFAANGGIIDALDGRCEILLTTPTSAYFRHDDGSADSVTIGGLLPYVWYVACARHVGGKIYFGINDARKLQMSNASSGNTAALTGSLVLGQSSASTYGAVDIAEVIVFKDDTGENTLRLMDYMLAEHVYRFKSPVLAMKDVGSRYLAMHRRPRLMVTLSPAPAELAVLELGKVVRLQQPLGSGSTLGWGASGPSSRPFRIVSIDRDPIANTLDLGLADVRDLCVSYRDTGIALRGVDTGTADWGRQEGVARLG